MIVTDYRGLSVGQLADVRNQLREAGASLTVAKNTLARIAAGQADKPDLVTLLQGPTAIAFVADDPAAAAKKLSEIARQTRILQVRGAIIEGETLSAEQVRELGDLPPRDVLQAQVVGAMPRRCRAPTTSLAAPLPGSSWWCSTSTSRSDRRPRPPRQEKPWLLQLNNSRR